MYLWTSEAVSKGHPDKVADQIADAVLDAYLKVEPTCRCACEVTLTKALVLVTGEVSSSQRVSIEDIVRDTLCRIGYDSPESGYDGNTIPILNCMNRQSPQIAAAVAKDDGTLGAGDQGMMFGFACNETPTYMPLAHHLAFKIIELMENADSGIGLLPDSKSQVTVRYDDSGKALGLDTVVVSTCHQRLYFSLEELQQQVREKVIQPFLKYAYRLVPEMSPAPKVLINPAGLWTLGGPAADTGLSGRKIVVDQYGADCAIGGGSFSGKDPTKVDRSGAYAARWLAKNIVAAGSVSRATVQLAYAIGVAQPVSVRVQTDSERGTFDETLGDWLRQNVDLTPKGIIDRLCLRQPIYGKTAAGGHFGRDEFPWENIDLAPHLKFI